MAITSSAAHGLEIGRRALQAHQTVINTTGNNIANANTPGFSRRQVNLEHVVSPVNLQSGSGVDAVTLVRLRSQFVDGQVRVQQQVLGHWEAFERGMHSLEAIFGELAGAGAGEAGSVFNESSGMGLSGSLSRFWNAWQDLANAPESGAARAAVRQEGEFLAAMLRQLDQQLLEARGGLDRQVEDTVIEVNELLEQLAAVNAQLPGVRFTDKTAPGLEDRRDLLLDQLSRLVGVSIAQQENGQVSVTLAGHRLLEGDQVMPLALRRLEMDGAAVNQVVFGDDRTPATIGAGALRGLLEVRDGVIPGALARLDQIAAGLVTEVNRVHREGFGRDGSTGIDFFAAERMSAGGMALSRQILEDLNHIAASGDGHVGDNGLALAIGGLRNKPVLAHGTATLDGFYRELLGDIGARSKEAQNMAGSHRLFAEQLDNRRQSIQGVSLNDEAAQLILFQRAYQAAARTVSLIDELLQVIVNL